MHWFLLPLIFTFCFSCSKPPSSKKGISSTKEVAYAQFEKTRNTQRIRRQQHDICDRLKKIQKRIEKAKAHKKSPEK
jgi:membrane-bound lytic murein transglycosylase MltF|tara:strand:- start:26504 stop:26734 length:231 start_codon:yes stop_codon:yes gene_type:complete